MGYKRAKTVKLTWADGEFEGLEVRLKRISIRKFFKLAPLIEGELDESTPEGLVEIEKLLTEFGRQLVSWNLEDEDSGGPVPCTADALLDLDPSLVKEILDQYGATLAGVSAPLEQPSSGGDPSLEGSLPMEISSPSPPS